MSALRIVFLGTPDFAVPSLRALLDGPDEVVGVVCQPDRPAGRGRRLQAPPVKRLALERGMRLAQPEKVRTSEFLHQLKEWDPEVLVVAAYGRILPKTVLDLPRFGGINVHASLLPKYRGAAPVQWAIARGEKATGVTIMQMSEGMDEGDILLQRETPIGAEETGGQLQERLGVLGAEVLREALDALRAGTLTRTPQDHRLATLAPMMKKRDGWIDWSRSAEDIARQVRAFNPWPSAFTTLGGRLIKIHRARALPSSVTEAPATVVTVGETLLVTTGSGLLAIEELQLEGRKRLPAAAFGCSGVLAVGTRFGEEPETN